ncbi:MAG: SDR family NAD(P)-dependent oxidoreductase [Bacteroidales bacterium]|jgi:farnesol dehydrogenase|nr:SDR family NAD(P)-dependent oxidoreductase [Bacteroidales bacterium]
MRFFITGATGFIGRELVKALIKKDLEVNLLVRSAEKIKSLASPKLNIVSGDITDASSVEKAMTGCTHVFHLAAYAKPSAVDPGIFRAVNVEGTRIILATALKLGIERVIFASSGATLATTTPYNDVTEESERPEKYHTEYAVTKKEAEVLCREYVKKGLDVITVYPTKVFGPETLTESNALTRIMSMYLQGRWRIIPGDGKTFGNYVFVEDVVNGMMLAMEKGNRGSDYILGGINASFKEFFGTLGMVSGKKRLMIRLPYTVMIAASAVITGVTRLLRMPSLITPFWVKHYLQHRRLSSLKAMNELGYTVTSLETGLRRTVTWLRQCDHSQNGRSKDYYTLITGASSGIGKALAIESARNGLNLFLVSLPETGLQEFARELSHDYGICTQYFEVNLCENDAHQKVLGYAVEKKLKVNILINNVGTGFSCRFESLSEQSITAMFLLNILTTTLLTKAFLPELQKADKACLMNIVSIAAFSPLPGKSVYAASKAYVMYLTRALRRELKASNVSVTGVFPGAVATNAMVRRRIEMGKWSAKQMSTSAEEVARLSISGMFAGKGTVIPGRKLKTVFYIGNLVPQGIVLFLTENELKKTFDRI